jgi:uncharacterized protein YdcH (DUF465 family)
LQGAALNPPRACKGRFKSPWSCKPGADLKLRVVFEKNIMPEVDFKSLLEKHIELSDTIARLNAVFEQQSRALAETMRKTAQLIEKLLTDSEKKMI